MEKSAEKLGCSKELANIALLESYFTLFDESRISKQARAKLISIFSEDMSFVLNGYRKDGIGEWEKSDGTVYTQVGKNLKSK